MTEDEMVGRHHLLNGHAFKQAPGDVKGQGPWVRKISWRRALEPTPVFLPGEFHGQRKLAGCCPLQRHEHCSAALLWDTSPPGNRISH